MKPMSKEQFLLPLIGFGAILFFALFVQLGNRIFREPPITPRTTVTIPEGSTVSEVNSILQEGGVLVDAELSQDLEGYLFPDTYEFFLGSSIEVVEGKFRETFEKKAVPVIDQAGGGVSVHEILTIASLIEEEVPDSDERKITSGIIWKRIKNGIPLQVDASICYIKESPCLPITDGDKNIDSPYNTYRYKGIPPGPISNPGADAIEASLNPEESPYLYYLSDPETGKTVFAQTLDEHNSNVVKYLGD